MTESLSPTATLRGRAPSGRLIRCRAVSSIRSQRRSRDQGKGGKHCLLRMQKWIPGKKLSAWRLELRSFCSLTSFDVKPNAMSLQTNV